MVYELRCIYQAGEAKQAAAAFLPPSVPPSLSLSVLFEAESKEPDTSVAPGACVPCVAFNAVEGAMQCDIPSRWTFLFSASVQRKGWRSTRMEGLRTFTPGTPQSLKVTPAEGASGVSQSGNKVAAPRLGGSGCQLNDTHLVLSVWALVRIEWLCWVSRN
jgi:hypothetical protein